MQYQWILDVLQDLRSFATRNGLNGLAEQLGDTALVAAAEITRTFEETGPHGDTAGEISGDAPVRKNP